MKTELKVAVRCDNEGCLWFENSDNPLLWLNKKCPECQGPKVIVDEKEAGLIRGLKALEEMCKEYEEKHGESDEKDMRTLRIKTNRREA